MPVTVKKCEGENGYVVKVDLPDNEINVIRVFLWGRFDCGDISWQSARAMAHRYADELRNLK